MDEDKVSGTIENISHEGDAYRVSFKRDDGKYGMCNLTLPDKDVLSGAFNKSTIKNAKGAKLEMELKDMDPYPQVTGVKVDGVSVMKPKTP
ncbi:MAG: hypothetical protein GC185_11595 [Alphaproteobacteria bacterium]|nr:hypothetical protein [Alphaproteobacteria bacterium]